MAYQAIGRGTSANDGTGDDLRTGAGKVNANFVEVYTKLGDGSTLTSDTVVLLAETQTLTNKSLTSPTITGTGAIAGVFTGNITGDVTGNVTGNVSSSSGNIQLDSNTQIVEVRGGGSNSGAITLNCEANTHGQKIIAQPHSASVTNVLTLPADGDAELVSTVATQTLTNKSLTSPTITGTGAIAGTFTGNITGNVTGNVTGDLTGAVTGTVQALSGAGAVDVTNLVTEITTTAADALTLADGTAGQIKIITMVADGGDGTLTPTTFANGSTITFNDVGDSVMLVYNTTAGWALISNTGCTIA